MIFEVKNAHCGYKSRTVIRDLSLTLSSGEIMCLLGPNGVGKTTFFKSALGFLPLLKGSILIDGEDIRGWSYQKLARHIGYVPQSHTPPFPFQVRDVVVMSRMAHHGLGSTPGREDMKIAEGMLEKLGIAHLADKLYTEISGGERQMALIARALTQEPKLLIMDEPTSNLDFGNQVRVLEQINALAAEGIAVLMTTHFPDHAYLCSSKVLLVEPGSRYSVGDADAVVTEENLRRVYGIDVRVVSAPDGRDTERRSVKGCIPLLRTPADERSGALRPS